MNCSDFSTEIVSYLTEDDFPLKRAEEIRQHYSECSECFDLLLSCVKVLELLKEKGIDGILDKQGCSHEDLPHDLSPEKASEWMWAKSAFEDLVEFTRRSGLFGDKEEKDKKKVGEEKSED